MFTTIEQVKQYTNYDVDADLILRAQAIIETFIGKVEAEVVSPNDLAVLGRATAFQSAYMKNNFDRIYEQMAIIQSAQTDSAITLDRDKFSPFIAPIAFMALTKLSWVRSRSIKVGSLYGKPAFDSWETA